MSKKRNPARSPLIHPIIVFPVRAPRDFSDLKNLYALVDRLDTEKSTYARPLTILDGKTSRTAKNKGTLRGFLSKVVEPCSDVIEAWCVDTCQMWYTGLGHAFAEGQPGDVYWLIPGDFDYGSRIGDEVLSRLHDLPEIILDLDQDLCIGEICTDHNNPKQIIDTYGTFALLYNWFPAEAQEIRCFTERPRSEFFALRHEFLAELLTTRWYAYEQTVVMLLQAVLHEKRLSRFWVGNITDLHVEGESLSSAIQQVERTERVLKSVWREHHEGERGWFDNFRKLELTSTEIRRAATTVLEKLLE